MQLRLTSDFNSTGYLTGDLNALGNAITVYFPSRAYRDISNSSRWQNKVRIQSLSKCFTLNTNRSHLVRTSSNQQARSGHILTCGCLLNYPLLYLCLRAHAQPDDKDKGINSRWDILLTLWVRLELIVWLTLTLLVTPFTSILSTAITSSIAIKISYPFVKVMRYVFIIACRIGINRVSPQKYCLF